MPIRLNPCEVNTPETSGADESPVSKLFATIVLRIMAVPPDLLIPPPSVTAVFPAKVEFEIVRVVPLKVMPPPGPAVMLLPEIVELVIFTIPLPCIPPEPTVDEAAVLPVTVQFARFSVLFEKF